MWTFGPLLPAGAQLLASGGEPVNASTSIPSAAASAVVRAVTGAAGAGTVNASTSAPRGQATTVVRASSAAGGATSSAPRVQPSSAARELTARGGGAAAAPRGQVTSVVRALSAGGTAATAAPGAQLSLATRSSTAAGGAAAGAPSAAASSAARPVTGSNGVVAVNASTSAPTATASTDVQLFQTPVFQPGVFQGPSARGVTASASSTTGAPAATASTVANPVGPPLAAPGPGARRWVPGGGNYPLVRPAIRVDGRALLPVGRLAARAGPAAAAGGASVQLPAAGSEGGPWSWLTTTPGQVIVLRCDNPSEEKSWEVVEALLDVA